MTTPRFTVGFLRGQCKTLEREVESQRLVTDEALAAVRPGGAKNPSKQVWGWVKYYGELCAFHERGVQHESGGTNAERTALAALARAPIVLTGLRPQADGSPTQWTVHPKGYMAHEYVHEKDLLLATLNGWTHRLHTSGLDNQHELAERVATERAYTQGLLAWIATTPGAYLPFDPHVTRDPDVPAEYRDLDEFDLLRIQQAWAKVNAGRGAALSELIAPPKDDGNPGHRGWSIFFSTLGTRMNTPVAQLMRDYTIPELLAQSYLAAGAEREAMDAARSRSEADRDDAGDDDGVDP